MLLKYVLNVHYSLEICKTKNLKTKPLKKLVFLPKILNYYINKCLVKLCFFAASNTRKYSYNVVFLFRSFLVLTASECLYSISKFFYLFTLI